ncbi:MAG: hypothetical protein IPM63_01365 [Acidobacteriota bacterium]|nr:MAG: hypothetical protein IPM63_01365 [Acidobacteriota bacterium]
MLDNRIPHKLKELIDRELEIGERIVWTGMPRRTFFTPAATGSFLFGIPWTAFAVFWTLMAGAGTWFTSGFSMFSIFPLFGIPFILIGIGMLSAPLGAYIKSGRTAYVITDKRAISFEGGSSTVIRSFTPEKLGDVFRRERSGGYGDVIIDLSHTRDSDGDKQTEEVGFFRVRDPHQVERLLKELASRAPARRRPEIPDDGSIYKF